MESAGAIFFILLVLFFWYGLYVKKKNKTPVTVSLTGARDILQQDVVFYQKLDEEHKKEFEQRVIHFLKEVSVTGVNTVIDDNDRVYVAASAVIPSFGFKEWEYVNINEVLLYPDAFNEEFKQKGSERNIAGMVGTGVYNNVMLLSQHELRQAFLNKTSKENTALHEFVHLLDKTDGDIDGIPEVLMDKQYILPWLNMIKTKAKEILMNKSDINPYGLTNNAEFLAVVSEYFFERPELLKQKHPDLYELLGTIFKQRL